MYLVAMSKDSGGNYHQRLHALDLKTGAELFGGPDGDQGDLSRKRVTAAKTVRLSSLPGSSPSAWACWR